MDINLLAPLPGAERKAENYARCPQCQTEAAIIFSASTETTQLMTCANGHRWERPTPDGWEDNDDDQTRIIADPETLNTQLQEQLPDLAEFANRLNCPLCGAMSVLCGETSPGVHSCTCVSFAQHQWEMDIKPPRFNRPVPPAKCPECGSAVPRDGICLCSLPATNYASVPTELISASLLTDKDVASMLNLSVSTVRKWRLIGSGPRYVKLGGSVRYFPADLNEWVVGQRREVQAVVESPKLPADMLTEMQEEK